MREAHRPTHSPATPTTEPQSELALRLAAGASVQEMLRRGEIGGQALGLLQMVAGREGGSRADARGSVQSLPEFN
jgi:hypothetical protein